MATVLASRYKIEDDSDSLLGMGGMGVVMKGLDQATNQPVAIKILKDGGRGSAYDKELLERFLREGEALRRLNHPNVVKLLDTFEENNRRYLIMELVPGGSLRDLLARGEKLHLSRFMHIAMDVCDALTRAHRLDIIHRDLKPDNVLLDSYGTARVTDFGVAHFEDRTQLTADGAMLGTMAYMSPEAVNGLPATYGTDIWAFGVMLYELLSGERPFRGSNPATVVSAILQAPVPPLGALRPGLPPELIALITRMLERDPTRRIGSLREVGLELDRLRTLPPFQPGAPEPDLTDTTQMQQASLPSGLPVRFHLTGKFTAQQALAALDEANRIFGPHDVKWQCVGSGLLHVDRAALEAAFPTHSKEPGHRRASADPLAAAPGYDPEAVNVYYTEEIRYLNKDLKSSSQEFRDRRLVIVPEKHYSETAGITLARALGVFLGLARASGTPEDRLVSLSGKGTNLSPEEAKEVKRRAEKLQAALAPHTAALPGTASPEIRVKLNVWLIRGGAYGTTLADAQKHLNLATWTPAGLRFDVEFGEKTVADADVEALFPGDDLTPQHKQNFALLGHHGGPGINLFLVKELPSAGRKTSYFTVNDRAARLLAASETAPARAVNRALAMFLGLGSNDYALPTHLMSSSGTGDLLTPEETRTVRTSAPKYTA